MRKLTIVLAVLMLFLQVFSCTVAYGSDGDIRIMACEPATNSPIHKDDVVEMGLVIKNETDKDMTDIEIIIKEASFSGWTSDQGPRIAELKSKEESDPIRFNVYYNGNGRDLVLEIRYKIEGKDDKAKKKYKNSSGSTHSGAACRHESICTQAGGGCRRNACDKCRQYIQIEIQDRQQKRTPS